MSAILEKSRPNQIRHRSLGRFAFVATLLLVVGASLWLARVQILRAAADFWIVSDPVDAADVVAIFGGGVEHRTLAAAGYFHHNVVKKILVANIREDQSEFPDELPSHTAANRDALLDLGVPEEAIEVFGDGLANTHQEALALRAWADRNNIHSVIVPTEIFPSRRVQWSLRQAFRNSNVRVRVVALERAGFTRTDWWVHKQGQLQFQNEVLKYLYYRWKY